MRMEVIVNGRTVPKAEQSAVLLGATERFHARRLQRRLERTKERLAHSPERQSVAIAMLAVEERLVKAFWTIARLPGAGSSLGRCGIPYVHEASDIHARYVDAAAGKWEAPPPRPSLPSAKDIDSANAALDWLLLIEDEGLRKLLVVGATSKRGDAGRQINWGRIRAGLRDLGEIPARSLNFRYQEALRIIVNELTILSGK